MNKKPIEGSLGYYRELGKSNHDIAVLVSMIDRLSRQLAIAMNVVLEPIPRPDACGCSENLRDVPLGLDESAVMQLIARMESHSDAANEEAVQVAEDHIDGCLCAYQEGAAYAYNDCANWLRDALLKPQGDQREKTETEAGNQP